MKFAVGVGVDAIAQGCGRGMLVLGMEDREWGWRVEVRVLHRLGTSNDFAAYRMQASMLQLVLLATVGSTSATAVVTLTGKQRCPIAVTRGHQSDERGPPICTIPGTNPVELVAVMRRELVSWDRHR